MGINNANMIVSYTSQSGTKEFQKGDYLTSRKHNVGSSGEVIEPGLNLLSEETINNGIQNIVENILNRGINDLTITMHAMAMTKISSDYPKLLITALRNQINKGQDIDSKDIKEEISGNRLKISAILISYNDEGSEKNIEGSNTFYPVRDIKKYMENSLLTSDADRTKIVDLEIFDSPSSKVLGFTFLGVLAQFLDFIENNKTHSISELLKNKLQSFLGDSYQGLIEMTKIYPFTGKVGEGQFSMKELGENGELDKVLNEYASKINFAKLSYLSGAISDLYLELAMKDLRENKDEILDAEGNRVLLNWNKISTVYDETEVDLSLILDRFDRENELIGRETSGVFVINQKDIGEGFFECEFNPTEKNFDIIGDNETGGHFGIIPLFMINGLVYDLGILDNGEYIKETKPGSMIFTGNKVAIKRIENEIIVYNADNESEIFSKIKITKNTEGKLGDKQGDIIGNDFNDYSIDGLPHGNGWIENFSSSKLETEPFGLFIDSKASIIESIGIRLARTYFLNPKPEDIKKLKTDFPKLKDFTELKGIFSKVTNTFYPNFDEKIKQGDFEIVLLNAKKGFPFLMFDVCVKVGGEIISEHTLTIS